ncbi:MtrB/PioB family decaheme-associated outer membrane protein [Shewanella avicenniae]|uniref:MtrB/PioB family decaheme-associated outer membrane protein n=1 Tax=Shewanella avicenniae TaxID=2814294 RepID=A0ABX7QTX7_9GAMM|nr:MtrB/PioB family decaheme-associated outer membrane protein [Shewanella avicenniae]QSX34884.1 MtrB/PioB family decaheme-associated outer membrane protein [Shewanella avicenniae]
MKFKLNVITIALLANASMAMAADGFNLANAKTDSIKFNNWKCSACKVEAGTEGSVTFGIGYADDGDDLHSANALDTENEIASKVSAEVTHIGESGYRLTVNARDLGMDSGSASISARKPGKYNVTAGLRQIATYGSDAGRTPFERDGEYLSLASDWINAGNNADLTGVTTYPVDLSLQRKRYSIGAEYTSDSLFTTYMNYLREDKTGTKKTTGVIFNQATMLPQDVDYTTDILEAGVKLSGDHWFSALSYSGSRFSNNNDSLGYDNPFGVTAGQTAAYLAEDPDNQAHTVSLSGVYTNAGASVSGRVLVGRMTQDDDLLTTGYSYNLPAESIDAQVDILGADIKAAKHFGPVKVVASYDYYDRDNKTDVEQWTQISISNVTGQAAYNTPFDSTTQKAKLDADYRIASGIKLNAGYDFEREERSYEDRETTDENTLWARFTLNNFAHWNMWVKGSYGERDGSNYQASRYTSSESNALLRKFYMANRNRSMVEMHISHTPNDKVTIDVGGRYAYDDYDKTDIGLTESRDASFDANVNYQATKDLNFNLFYNHQLIKSELNGSSAMATPDWYSHVEDTFDVVGFGAYYDNLLEKKLRLGVDYTYSDSDSTTQVRQALSGDYGAYYAKQTALDLYANYQATEKVAVRLDYRMQKYEDNDASNDLDINSIWNVVSLGNTDHDYTAHLIMLSVNYKL